MGTFQTICESCKIKLVEVLEEANEDMLPYCLCKQCYNRLINYALRPLEFFNLAAIHGHDYYLHDDFYDYQTGEATQPNIQVSDVEKYPFPDLERIESNLEILVDFACVQYFTSNEVIQLLKGFNKQEILSYLDSKVKYNRAINYKAYEIAAKVLGSYAADWIRKQWNKREGNELLIFAEAISRCLPNDEAIDIITKEIEKSSERQFAENSNALLYLHDARTLQWIEKSKEKIVNVSSNWGLLAATSQFDWRTAESWIIKGRPLSLIALDALNFCTKKVDDKVLAYWRQEDSDNNPVVLYHSPNPDIIIKIITEYLQKDNVPRTRATIKQIISNLSEIN